MKIILLDRSMAMVKQWKQAFVSTGVESIHSDFTLFMDQRSNEIDCVVSPANSYGLMDGGYDLALTRYFGEDLPHAVQAYIREHYHGEQPVGTSFLISIPNSTKCLIHTPTMRVPSPIIDWLTIYHAMRSTLLEALRNSVGSILIPAFGGNCGGVPYETVAKMMRLAYDQVFSSVPQVATWEYAYQRTPETLRQNLCEETTICDNR